MCRYTNCMSPLFLRQCKAVLFSRNVFALLRDFLLQLFATKRL
ncbi:hypothetical protein ESCAB7627_4877 [Escherichia albertii TW07627]|uniref:Uncharacterized protein n=1 Tax=Escherichia albertii (strain TW07627) TaxID=502347 RepID=A0ABC9NIZ6_ESCAT|nr:hypothetical protein ESCAB7627_4877 [Escherichia albertii TW07627]